MFYQLKKYHVNLIYPSWQTEGGMGFSPLPLLPLLVEPVTFGHDCLVLTGSIDIRLLIRTGTASRALYATCTTDVIGCKQGGLCPKPL